MKPKFRVVHDILPEDDLAFIRRFAEDNLARLTPPNGNVNDVYNGKTIQFADVDSERARKIMQRVNDRGIQELKNLFSGDVVGNIESDGIMINLWPVGMGLGAHADNAFFPTGDPNYTPWRDFSGVFYINDDYEGGEFYFDNTDIFLKPVANTIVVFGAGLDSVHGVTPVTSGERWTMPNWFTRNPEYFARNQGRA